MPKAIDLSIIIPNFNSGKLLDHTLASVFSKESIYSFEVLIMDNLSTDNPKQYIDNYPQDSILYHSELDSGIYEAMNKGVKLVKGNWVIFLGAGDTIEMDEIEKIDFGDSDLVYCNTRLIASNQVYDGRFDKLKILYKNISHQAIIYNRNLFSLFGLFNTKYDLWADYLFNLNVFFNSKVKISYFNLVISNYYGRGVSDKKKDFIFSSNKNKIFINILLCNLTWENVVVFYKFYVGIFKVKIFKL